LAALHIHPKSDAIKAAAANAAASPLAGKTLMVTGTLATMSRDEAFEKIRAAGGNVSNSISSKTSFLVAGESAGSKLEKAQGLGVKVLTERQFLDLIGSL
jgi:DNA ligase (NAD+)